MALDETSSFLQPYVYVTLADPAMPISPTYVAADYPLCKSLCKPLLYVGLARTVYIRCVYITSGRETTKYIRSYTVYINGSGQPYIYGVYTT